MHVMLFAAPPAPPPPLALGPPAPPPGWAHAMAALEARCGAAEAAARNAAEQLEAAIAFQQLQRRAMAEKEALLYAEHGAEVARLRVYRGSTLALEAPLAAGETVALGPLHRRAFDASLELGQSLFRKYVLKQ
jgi:hypothetical protein